MVAVSFINLGKCMLQRGKEAANIVDDLVLNTSHISKVVPKTIENNKKLGAKITTIFNETIDVPAPGIELDSTYNFRDIIDSILSAGKTGYCKLV